MKLALAINDFNLTESPSGFGPALTAIGQAAEAAGFDSLAVMDHVWQHPMMGGVEGPVLECYTTLAYLAARTDRISLLALATPASYRFSGMLAKMVTTLDVLSGGRAWLGIGAGDYEDEAVGLGIPFPPVAERFDLLEETIVACLRMWQGEQGDEQPYRGRLVQMERPLNLPQSLSRPHPPILIAGGGERRTLPLVARYGDACNLPPGPEIPRQLELLRRLCDAERRDYDAIVKTCPYRFDVGHNGAGVSALIGQLRQFADWGIQTVFGRVVDDFRLTPIEVMGREVIPAVAGF